MYLVVHFIWVQLQHMKYNGQSYFVFIYYYNHFLGKKIVNLYLYVIRRNIGFVYTFQKIIVVVFQLCVFKMQSLHGRLLSKVLAHLLSVFCSTTVKVHKFKSKKKKWIIHSADFQDYYIIQFSGMLQSGCPISENFHSY